MTNHKMHPIPQLRDYCGNGNPIIRQEFSDQWRTQTYRKRASVAWLRKLRTAGVTRIAVEVEPGTDRLADFSIAELMPKAGLRG